MLGSKEQRTEGIKRQAQELINQAYVRGFNAGYDEHVTDTKKAWETAEREAYQRGLDDAWECARKIFGVKYGYTHDEIIGIYGRRLDAIDLSPSEAIEKIKAYEERKKAEEVKVGTRVRTIKDKDNAGTTLFPVGTIGVVKEIDTSTTLPYLISTDNDTFYYSRDMFEVIGEDKIHVGDEVEFDGGKGVVIDILNDDEMYILNDNGCIEKIEIRLTVKTGRVYQIGRIIAQLQEGEHE